MKKCTGKHNKCVVCQGKHQATADSCPRRKHEQQRLVKTRNLKMVPYPTKPAPVTPSSSQIAPTLKDFTDSTPSRITAIARKEGEILTVTAAKPRIPKDQITSPTSDYSRGNMPPSSPPSATHTIMDTAALRDMEERISVRLMSTMREALAQGNPRKRRAEGLSGSSSKGFGYGSATVISKTGKAITTTKPVRAPANTLNKRRKAVALEKRRRTPGQQR